MYPLLHGLRVVEGASFIAGPSGGLHLLQMGAEVIRFDPIGGGPDRFRWPLAPSGASLYWEGLNKGKKSIAIDLSRPEGRELAQRVAVAGDAFLTNYPAEGFLSHARLAALRPDAITVRVTGWGNGAPAFDYTVNAAIGIPLMTGPASAGDAPVNHVLPAWDLFCGAYAAFALLAAERHRRATGQGQEVRVPLGDMAIASLAHMGMLAEVAVSGQARPRIGNDLFGAFGRDFVSADGQRVMVVALTRRQWRGLLTALEIADPVAALEAETGADFAADEGARFTHRDRLFPLVEEAMARRPLAELAAAFDANAVTWGGYQTLLQALDDPRLVRGNPVFAPVSHPSGETYPTPGAGATLPGLERGPPPRAPALGEHTEEVLADLLGLPGQEIAALHDRGLVAGPGRIA